MAGSRGERTDVAIEARQFTLRYCSILSRSNVTRALPQKSASRCARPGTRKSAFVKSFGHRRRTTVSEERTRGRQSGGYGDFGNCPCVAGRLRWSWRPAGSAFEAYCRWVGWKWEHCAAKSRQRAETIMSDGAVEPLGRRGLDRRRDKATTWRGRGPCRVTASCSRLVLRPLSAKPTVSPNVVQNQPMKSGRGADDCRPLQLPYQLSCRSVMDVI
jgi:hypothetical protein